MLRSKQRLYVVIGLLVLTTMSLLVLRLSQRAVRDIADGYRTLVTIFLGIFIEALPFLLLGTLASGLVEEFLSREALGRLVPRNRLGSTLTGALMGLAFPVCECGVVPLTRRLFRKGLPLPMGVAFLLAAPVINPVVIASTYAAFGWGPVLLGRVAFTLLIAMTVGLIFGLAPHPRRLLRFSAWPVVVGGGGSTELTKVGLMELTKVGSMELTKVGSTEPTKVGSAQLAETGAKPPGEATSRSALSVRLNRALIVAGDEFFEMGRYLVLGSLLAAGMQTVVPQSALLAIGRGALSSVLAMLALAFVLSVCSTVDAFVALAFVNTFTTGSILGFLVFGPMVDIKSVLMFLSVFRRRVVLYLVLLPFMMSLFIAVYLNLNAGW
jgi:uncharacterized membrane protein YraQ (UPF0718 family)